MNVFEKQLCALRGANGAILGAAFTYDDQVITAEEIAPLSVATCHAHSAPLQSPDSPTEEQVVTGDADRCVKVWDMEKTVCTRTIHTPAGVSDLCVSRAADSIFTGHKDGTLRCWSTKGRGDEPILEMRGLHTQEITSVCMSDDGNTILTNSVDNTLQVVDARMADEPLQTLKAEGYSNNSSGHGGKNRAAISPDGAYAVAGSQVREHSSAVERCGPHVAISPAMLRSSNAVAGSQPSRGGGLLYVWDARSGEQIGEGLKGHDEAINAVCWGRKGVASTGRDRQCLLWATDME